MRMNLRSLSTLAGAFLAAALAFAAGVEVLHDVPSTYVYPVEGFLPFNLHRGTQTLLSLMLPGASFNDPRGVACALLRTDHHSDAPQDDVEVTCVGVNSGAGEIIYNVGLKDLRRFGSPGSGEKQFLTPMGVAIDTGGDVAVADTGNDRVSLLKHDGLRMQWVREIGKRGKRPGEFQGPMAVAYDSQGRLYVADTGNDRIQMMDPKGKFHVLPVEGLEGPSAIAVIDGKEAWTFYREGPYADRLAVIDRKGTRLQTFPLSGGVALAGITADQIPDPPVRMWGCAFDYLGNVVATDFDRSCLRKFDKDLGYVVSFGSEGVGDFQFTQPRGIAINHQFGQVLVAEKDCVQYFWNGADAVGLKAQVEGPKVKVNFLLTEKATVDAEVEDGDGKTLQDLSQGQVLEQGPQELDWTPSTPLPQGPLTLKMRLMATYSSRERVAKELDLPLGFSR